MAKLDTAKAIIRAIQTMSTVNDLGPDLVKEYFDAGTFVDGDVSALGITAAQLGSCITLLQQCGLLMSGANDGAVIVGGAFGCNGATAQTRLTVTGSRGGNAALASLLTQLVAFGFITDNTSA